MTGCQTNVFVILPHGNYTMQNSTMVNKRTYVRKYRNFFYNNKLEIVEQRLKRHVKLKEN
jgi:hypothetical protein